jgi:hypothetical protein
MSVDIAEVSFMLIVSIVLENIIDRLSICVVRLVHHHDELSKRDHSIKRPQSKAMNSTDTKIKPYYVLYTAMVYPKFQSDIFIEFFTNEGQNLF